MNVVNASQSPGVTILVYRAAGSSGDDTIDRLQTMAIPRNLSHVATNKHMEFLLCKHLPHYHHSSLVCRNAVT